MNRYIKSLLIAGAFASEVIMSGCYTSVGVRTYDPYYTDYHVWSDAEAPFYNNWVVETRHRPGIEYRRLRRDDQRAYWRWRHDHH